MEETYRGFRLNIRKIGHDLYNIQLKHPNGKIETADQIQSKSMKDIETSFKFEIDCILDM
jgi:hypothetical protein